MQYDRPPTKDRSTLGAHVPALMLMTWPIGLTRQVDLWVRRFNRAENRAYFRATCARPLREPVRRSRRKGVVGRRTFDARQGCPLIVQECGAGARS